MKQIEEPKHIEWEFEISELIKDSSYKTTIASRRISSNYFDSYTFTYLIIWIWRTVQNIPHDATWLTRNTGTRIFSIS